MSIIDEVLAREARKAALKKARREKWVKRLQAMENRLREFYRSAVQRLPKWHRRPSPPQPIPTASVATTTPKKVAHRDKMWSVAGAALLAAVLMMAYGLSSLSEVWTALLPKWAWIVVAALVSALLAWLIYHYKISPNRKKTTVQAPSAATAATPAQPATTTVVVTRRTVPSWAAAIFWLILGAVVLLALGWGGYKLFAGKPMVQSSAPVTADGEYEIVLRSEESTAVFKIAVMHRWDMLDPVPESGWRMRSFRDAESFRIQIFELVPPATEVKFKIKVSKCAIAAGCAW